MMQPKPSTSSTLMRRQFRDGIVVLAMSVIASSLGYVLFRQFDLGMGLSLITALAVYVALICLHVSLRRGEQTAGLRAEIAELEHELSILKQKRQPLGGAPSPAFVAGAKRTQTEPAARPAGPLDGRPAKAKPGSSRLTRAPLPIDDAVERALHAGKTAAAHAARANGPAPELKAVRGPVQPSRQARPSQQAKPSQQVKPAPRPKGETKPGPAGAGARLDVDRIEGLIRSLADDLSESDATVSVSAGAVGPQSATVPKPAKQHPADPVPTPSLPEKSTGDLDPMISALRTVSERMRASGPKGATSQPAQVAGPEVSERQALGPAAKPAKPAAQSTKEAGSPVVAAVADAIERERIDLYLQPIFGLNQRRAKHFELSARLRDRAGVPMMRAQYAGQLHGTGLLPQVDLAMLAAAGKIIRRLVAGGKSHNLFSNVASASLADDAFLEVLANELRMQDKLSGHLVVSFAQSAVQSFAPVHWDTLSTLAGLGFRFSLEAVTNLDIDFERLKENGFAFVKLDADVFLRGLPAGETVIPSADLCRHLAQLSFGLIVDQISDERSLELLQRDGVLLGQGVLLGDAKPVKAEILAEQPKTNAA